MGVVSASVSFLDWYCPFGVNKICIFCRFPCLLLELARLEDMAKILTLLEDECLSPKIEEDVHI
jgi:hypothetical protein